MHAQAESLLLEQGSRQPACGSDYHPGKGRAECIEFTSLINLRPARESPPLAMQLSRSSPRR